MFHSSPTTNQESIRRQGLLPRAAFGGLKASGVYLWSDLDLHRQLIAEICAEEGFGVERPFDLWQVEVDGIVLEPDTSPGPRAAGAFYTPEPVGASRLTLLASYASVAGYLGVSDLDDLVESYGLAGVCAEYDEVGWLDDEPNDSAGL